VGATGAYYTRTRTKHRPVCSPAHGDASDGRDACRGLGHKAVRLREDFCGTAQLSTTWVERDVAREAVGVDLDAEVLAWAQARHGTGAHSDRLRLVHADVLTVEGLPLADIVCAFNFSVK
jgi:hypothetical protein